MDAYDCHQIDKAMSKKVDAIYSDPKRHKFYSCHQLTVDVDERGPRGGKVRGRKTICYHCGYRAEDHVEETEAL